MFTVSVDVVSLDDTPNSPSISFPQLVIVVANHNASQYRLARFGQGNWLSLVDR